MKRVAWAALVLALGIAAAVLWWRSGAEQGQLPDIGEPVHAPSAAVGREEAAAVVRKAAPPPPQDAQPAVPRSDYAAQLRAAPDYLEFVRSLLGAASAGDHAAQFYVFRAFDYCDGGYRAYFGRPGARRTLDDAMKRQATRWPYETEEVRLVHTRCHTLMESDALDPGGRFELLRQAAEGGYPLAQITLAQRPMYATVAPNNDDAANADQTRRLVAMAIRSRDPEVIWGIASTQLETEPGAGMLSTDYLPWYLVACLRGFDCSPHSEAVRQLCRLDPNCQPFESVADVLRRASEDEFPELESRARWINEKIDAGDWEALGF